LRVLTALNYWQLRVLRGGRQGVGAAFSERIRSPRTLKADWIFRSGDTMKRLRAGICGPQMTAQSV
jgi:hypothetical protein